MRLLPRKIARCSLYMFISSALYVQIPGALDYYYLVRQLLLKYFSRVFSALYQPHTRHSHGTPCMYAPPPPLSRAV